MLIMIYNKNFIFNLDRCPNLIKYYETIKQEFWSDWDKLLRKNASFKLEDYNVN
jgi:hypothetical protein